MELQKIEEIAQKVLMRKAHEHREKGFIYTHGQRVARLCKNLCDALGVPYDADVLYVACLFHDIGKGLEPHEQTGAVLAPLYLKGTMTDDEMSAVTTLIASHKSYKQEDTPLVQVLQDADILDHIGGTELWMNFLWNYDEEKGQESVVDFYQSEEANAHFNNLFSLLHYDLTRELYKKRLAFVHAVSKQIEKEIAGEIC